MKTKLQIILQIILALAAFSGSVYVAVTPANSMINWYNGDDAFYYYKVAQNILAGHGSTFDGINLTNGYHPLWMVVCLGVFWLSRYNLLLPLRVLIIVSGLFNAATVVVLYRFLRKYIHPGAALVTGLVWGLYPAIFDATIVRGMESVISSFLLVLLISRAASLLNSDLQPAAMNRGLIGLGLIGAFTILARLDNVFVVGLIGLFVLLKIKKIPALVLFDFLLIGIAVFLAWILRLGSEKLLLNTYTVYSMLMISVLIKPVCLYFAGAYSSVKAIKGWNYLLRLLFALGAGFIFEYVLLAVLFNAGLIKMFSKSIMIIDVLISFALIVPIHFLLIHYVPKVQHNPFTALRQWIRNRWKSVLTGGLCYGSPIAVLIGAYMIYNRITFGSVSPVSGQVKHWWSTMINTVYSRPITLISVLGLSPSAGNGPWSLIASKLDEMAGSLSSSTGIGYNLLFFGFTVILLVVFLLILRANQARTGNKFFALLVSGLFLGCIVHITYYFASGYTHTRGWYWVAEMLAQVLCGSLVLDFAFSSLDKLKSRRILIPFIAWAAIVLIGYGHYRYLVSLAPAKVAPENQAHYLVDVNGVEFYTNPNTLIGMTGGGMISYFIQDRTIVNLDGLINSVEYFNALKNGRAAEFLDDMGLDYVFGKPYMLLESDPYGGFLKNRLNEIGYIRGVEGFTLFKYVESE